MAGLSLLLLALAAQAQPAPATAPVGPAVALASEIREVALDSNACYRVRDLDFGKEDIRFYFTDGYLIFSKPVLGRRLSAVYQAIEPNDDAEVIVRPPDRGERTSLASHIGSPTLDEHFRSSVMVFTDGSAEELLKSIKEAATVKPEPEMGLVLAARWNETQRNLTSSYLVRVVVDLLSNVDVRRGFFYAAIGAAKIGTFDVLHDPLLPERIVLGTLDSGGASPVFDLWSSFESRSQRLGHARTAEDLKVDSYRIRADFGVDLNLDVVTTMTITPLEPLQGAIAFDIASQMEVTGASINGKPVEVFRRESLRENLVRRSSNEVFLVTLPGTMATGQKFELEVRHRGQVVRAAGNDVYYVAARSNWYPTRGPSFSKYDLQFRIPKELTLVATGEPVEERIEGNMRIVQRKTSSPVRLAAFNLGTYRKISLQRNGYTIDVFANLRAEPALQNRPISPSSMPPLPARPPGRRPQDIASLPLPPPPDPTAHLGSLASEMAGALEWMSSIFGPPTLTHLTVSPIPGNFGQGFPGLIYLSTLSFLPPEARPVSAQSGSQNLFFSELLHAHEIAHQWWGNLVMSASYHDEWLQEALANYSALMVLEKKKGPKAIEGALEIARNNLLRPYQESRTVESAGPVTWGSRLPGAGYSDPWRSITYDKGGWIIHMLRRYLGDAQFLALLTATTERYRYKTLSSEQFRQLAAEFMAKDSSDPKLENFFDNWVYSTGVPDLDLKCTTQGKAPKVTLACNVVQKLVPDDFSIDVPVEIRTAGAKPITRWLRTSSEGASFAMTLKAPPQKVELGSVLKRSGQVH